MKAIIFLVFLFMTTVTVIISIRLGIKNRRNFEKEDNKNMSYKSNDNTSLKKYKNKFLIVLILLVVFIAISIVLGIKVKKQDVEYQTIKCTVSNIETKRVHVMFTHITTYKYKVKVRYNNIEYDLKNEDESGWKYKKGDEIVAYYKDNNVYANIEGIKTSTFLAKLYFTSLAISGILITIIIYFVVSYKINNRKNLETPKNK